MGALMRCEGAGEVPANSSCSRRLMAGPIVAGIVCAVVLVAAGPPCSSAFAGSRGRPEEDAARRVVTEYVEALAHGDVPAALGSLCREATAPREQSDSFATQNDDQWKRLGSFLEVKTRIVPATGSDAYPQTRDLPRKHVGYRIVTEARTYPELTALVVQQDNAPRICGTSSTRSQAVCKKADHALRPGPTTPATPRELTDLPGPPGTTTDEDHRLRPTKLNPSRGLVSGWTRTWRKPEFGGSRVAAGRFHSSKQALTRSRAFLIQSCADAVSTFTVPSLDGAIGLRIRTYAWLGLQPPDQGPYSDWLDGALGSTRVSIGSSPLEPGDNHAVVELLAEQMNERTEQR